MLGTFALIGLFVAGVWHAPLWIIVPFAVLNTFIGAHYPAGKALQLKEHGIYWRTLIVSSPPQLIVAGLIFAIGYGAGLLFR